MTKDFPDYGPYHVIRYPTYYVVQDNRYPTKSGAGKIVFETRSSDVAHRKARELAREFREDQRQKQDCHVCGGAEYVEEGPCPYCQISSRVQGTGSDPRRGR